MTDGDEDGTGPPPSVEREVVGAVKRALARHGYADLTTERIAEEYDKSESSLFHYYDSKEDLVVAFLESTTEWMASQLDERDVGDPIDRLTSLCWTLSSDFEDPMFRDLYLAIREITALGPRNERFLDPLVEHGEFEIRRIEAAIAHGIELGYFRAVDPDRTALVLKAMCDAAVQWDVVYERPEYAEAMREAIIAYVDQTVVLDPAERTVV